MTDQIAQTDPSCMDDFDPNSISAEEALKRILDTIIPIQASERVFIRDGLGRVLSEDIQSKINVFNSRESLSQKT